MVVSAREIMGRLEAAERENRELRQLLRHRTWMFAASLGGVIGLGLLVMWAADGVHAGLGRDMAGVEARLVTTTPARDRHRVVEAEGFVVKDARGRIRASLGRTGHPTDDRHAETGLHLWTDGAERGKFVVDGHGWGVITFQNALEDERLSIVGESSSAGLSVSDEHGDQRIDLTVSNGGSPMLVLNGKGLDPRIQMGVLGDGKDSPSFLTVFDKAGKDYPFLGRDGLPLFNLHIDRPAR